ncbi:MAG: tetratricopeptide repeat protein [Bacteroidota bacterium]
MDEQQINQLADEAWEAIQTEDWATAEAHGQSLLNLPHEYGYRILSMTALAQEDVEQAIRLTQEGIKAFPEAWQLQMQLGNIYLEGEDMKPALKAFEKALEHPAAEKGSIRINQAIAYYQAQQLDEALNALQLIEEEQYWIEALAMKLGMLEEVGRSDLVKEVGEEELESLPLPETEDQSQAMGRICLHIARACWEADEEEATTFYLRQAIEYDRTQEQALWLWRERDPSFSDDPKAYSILMTGKMRYQEETVDFMTTYGVIADSLEEAVEFIKAYEIEAIDRDSLGVLEVEEGKEEELEVKGVYMVGGFGFMDETPETPENQA